MRIQPFYAERPPPALAAHVASLPYDVVDTRQARRIGLTNPASFLHVIRPEIDLPEETPLYDNAVYAQGRRALNAFREQSLLQRDPDRCLYLYRLSVEDHHQLGVVATCHVDDYEQNIIRRHEHTLPGKENDRTRHIDALDAHTGPVFLAYRDRPSIDRLQDQAAQGSPLYDFTADDGVRHTVWRITATEPWVKAFAEAPAAYVADGHHRAASAARVCALRRTQRPSADPAAPHHWFLTVLFPASQLRILPYQRLVADLNGMSPGEFLAAIERSFVVAPAAPGDRGPERPGEVYVRVDEPWRVIRWTPPPGASQVERLDVSILQQQVLSAILGIQDPRQDPRIQFVGGARGLDPLEQAVRSGQAAAAFALYPTFMHDLMAVADAGLVMPPKSTWFDPKLRSGLFVYSLSNPSTRP
jgi:uncharacterized protein (DUF1015 family)